MALDKEKILASAQKYEDKSQYEKAIREYQKIIEIEPKNERVLLNTASCYDNLGKRQEAARYYSRAAGCYRTKGAYQKAVAVFKQAQKCLPDDDVIAMDMAELYTALGLQHEAIGQLEKCLARSERANDRRAVTKILQTMVKADSENIQTRTRYAQVILEDGDVEGATRQYTLALAQLLSKERYVDYIQTSREYLKIVPNDADVLQELGKIYIRMERYNDALALLSPIRSEERSPQIRELFINCYIKLHRTTDAGEELKALARQYEAEGGRSDLIEDAWQRARKLLPNDPEVSEFFGDEPPLLSDSALNIVSPGIETDRTNGGDSLSQVERMLAQKFSHSMEAYRQGRISEAKTLCLQIIDSDEQYMPALQLLSQICENDGDNLTLAQIERKLAKAVFDSDPDAAVRHVLKAEKCTPGAWENFNLLLVFGLEPSRYGLKAPNSFTASSSARIAVSPAPSPAPAKRPGPPPLPGKRTKPAVDISLVERAFQNWSAGERYGGGSNAPHVDGNEITRNPALDYIPEDVEDAFDDAFDDLLKTPTEPVQAVYSEMPEWMNASNSVAQRDGAHEDTSLNEAIQRRAAQTAVSGPQSGIPLSKPGIPLSPRAQGIPLAQRPQAVPLTQRSQSGIPLTQRSQPGIPLTQRSQPGIPLTQRSQPGIPLAQRPQAVPLTQRSQPGIPLAQPAPPVAEPAPTVPLMEVVGIPDSERHRVTEAIQEIDFYASLMLMNDAHNLLQKLIDEFGDVDIIHEAKLRLG